MMCGSMESSQEPNRKERIEMLTLGEAQDIFIDALPSMELFNAACTPATDAEPTYIEYWQCSNPCMIVHWYDGPGYPVMIEIETEDDLPRALQRDIVDPEDLESVVAWLTQN
nr:MAG TPA: hypothetical protein [Caudoviricetes sp.]